MDYCSLCQKACLGGFLKNIHRPNPVTVVEMNILPPKMFDIVKYRFILPGAICFFIVSFSLIFRVFNESKWLPDFAEVIFCVCVFICVIFFSYLLWKIRTLGFLDVSIWFGMWIVRFCPIIDPTMTFYKFWSLVKVAILLRWTLLSSYLKHTQLVPPAFPLSLQF